MTDERIAALTLEFAAACLDDGPDRVNRRRAAAAALEAVAPGCLEQMAAGLELDRMRLAGRQPQ